MQSKKQDILEARRLKRVKFDNLSELRRQTKHSIKQILDEALAKGLLKLEDYQDRLSNLSTLSDTPIGTLLKLKENLANTFRAEKALTTGQTLSEGSEVHSHLHGDPEPAVRISSIRLTPFQEFRKKHLSKIKEFNSQINHDVPISVGEIQVEESRIVYSDGYGIKRTNWFPDSQSKARGRILSKKNFHIHSYGHRVTTYEVFITPENVLEHDLISTQVL